MAAKTYLRVRHFSRYQHYKDRPDNPWVKFYVKLLEDEEMNALPVSTRLLYDRLLLLAQRYANVIPNDIERLAGLTAMPTSSVRDGIFDLIEGGWLSETTSPRRASKRASNPASKHASAEQRQKRERTTAEQNRSKTTRANSLPALTHQQRPTSTTPGAQRILNACDVFDHNTVTVIENLCQQLLERPHIINLVEAELLAADTRQIRRSKTALAVRLLQDGVATANVKLASGGTS